MSHTPTDAAVDLLIEIANRAELVRQLEHAFARKSIAFVDVETARRDLNDILAKRYGPLEVPRG